ncbi:MAG: VanZ family protein [Sedimentisphaerales bacterium]|nr:VanZ family protein [Sedimentisphaerales bacterium]
MIPSRRSRLNLVLLLLYWLAIFVLAHIQIPKIIYKVHVSDKTLHFMVYMILVFLLWSALNPYSRVNWRKSRVWWTLFIVVWYGVIDEWLQTHVGRSCDMMDFVADLVGAAACLLILTFLGFWSASLAVTGVSIFLFANVAQAHFVTLLPTINAAIGLFSYALFTYLWIQNLDGLLVQKSPGIKWTVLSLTVPMALLAVVKFGSVFLGRTVSLLDIISSAAGIVAVVTAVFLLRFLLSRGTDKIVGFEKIK